MKYKTIRNTFINFFKKKKHKVFPSFPIFLKNDLSNLFVNSGMNPFKDYFLGYKKSNYSRIVNIQKCLRVTGKHNDFEQVGYDNYHHTMFEMMGSWSFGDYSREKAIEWAWDLLVNVYNIPKNDIYVTIFVGDKKDELSLDKETLKLWNYFIKKDNILFFGKEHNFWEMGEIGPCGPCTEIHIDLRNNLEKNNIDGKNLINKNHPKVIEIWNIVFIEYTREINKRLKPLSIKHVDTGMGIERLCMVLQKKNSSYETDIFYPIICNIKEQIGYKDLSKNQKISIQIIADHLRAVIFSIFDGLIPSNNKAGYVIRKILRRAFIHSNLFLEEKKSFVYKFVIPFIEGIKKNFPELECKKKYIYDIIKSEEISFMNIIKSGDRKIYNIIDKAKKNKDKVISGEKIFKLYDTYGFPIEISKIIIDSHKLFIDENTFYKKLSEQKERSRNHNNIIPVKQNWIQVYNNYDENIFVGYKDLECYCYIKKYRKITQDSTKNNYYELVFTKTPFYPKGGGQIGDTGFLLKNDEKISIIDTKKENSDIIHITEKLPSDIYSIFKSSVNKNRRKKIEKNHTSTHLLNFALRKVLNNDIEQKGSYVGDDYLRFDFSYHKKITNEKLIEIENYVQELIYHDLPMKEKEFSSLKEAKKYLNVLNQKYFEKIYGGKKIRMISFGDSHEFCIGTHIKSTGLINLFKIISEGAVSYGIRRIKAFTSKNAIKFLNDIYYEYDYLKKYLNWSKNPIKKIIDIKNKYTNLKKDISELYSLKIFEIKNKYIKKIIKLNQIRYICEICTDSTDIKYLDQSLIKKIGIDLTTIYSNLFMFTGFIKKDKYFTFIFISNDIIIKKHVNAYEIMCKIIDKKCLRIWGNKNFSISVGNNIDELDIFFKKIKKYIKSTF